MKHYFQTDSGSLKRQPLQASGRICDCCDGFLHSAEGEEHKLLEDDVECPRCGKLCSCECHRRDESHEPAAVEAPPEK